MREQAHVVNSAKLAVIGKRRGAEDLSPMKRSSIRMTGRKVMLETFGGARDGRRVPRGAAAASQCPAIPRQIPPYPACGGAVAR
jgi:hypothetical protein